MKHIGQTLKIIIEHKKIRKKELAEKLSITPVYLSLIFQKATIDAALLEQFCNALDVSPLLFFDLNENIITDRPTTLEDLIMQKDMLIAEKDKIILSLMQEKIGTESEHR